MALFGKKPEPPRTSPASTVAEPKAEPKTEEEPEIEALETPPLPPTYGIHETIRLMRSLPVDKNADLVVRVIKSTLESLHVRVVDIVDDANRQEAVVVGRMRELSREVENLQHEIDVKRRDLGSLESELAEIKLAKERLLLTSEIRSRVPSVPPPLSLSAVTTPHPVPAPVAPSSVGAPVTPSSVGAPVTPNPVGVPAAASPVAAPAAPPPGSASPPPFLRTPPPPPSSRLQATEAAHPPRVEAPRVAPRPPSVPAMPAVSGTVASERAALPPLTLGADLLGQRPSTTPAHGTPVPSAGSLAAFGAGGGTKDINGGASAPPSAAAPEPAPPTPPRPEPPRPEPRAEQPYRSDTPPPQSRPDAPPTAPRPEPPSSPARSDAPARPRSEPPPPPSRSQSPPPGSRLESPLPPRPESSPSPSEPPPADSPSEPPPRRKKGDGKGTAEARNGRDRDGAGGPRRG